MGAIFSRPNPGGVRIGLTIFFAVYAYLNRRHLARLLGGARKALLNGDRQKRKRLDNDDAAGTAGAAGESKDSRAAPGPASNPAAVPSPSSAATSHQRQSIASTPSAESPTASPAAAAAAAASPTAAIEERFEEAQERWPTFQQFATDADKKRLYGLYKYILQGTATPADAPPQTGEGSRDPIRRWKWEAWSGVQHDSSTAAKREYSELVFEIGTRGAKEGVPPTPATPRYPGKPPSNPASPAAAPAPVPAPIKPTVRPVAERFAAASEYLKDNGSSLGLGNTDLLAFYGWFKQAKNGPCTTSRPGMWSGMEKGYKWDAWSKLGGMSKETAMQAYVDALTKRAPNWEGGNAGGGGGSGGSSGSSGNGGSMGLNVVSTFASGKQGNDGTNDKDWQGHSAELHAAASAGRADAVATWLSKSRSIGQVDEKDDTGMTALMWACEKGHDEVVDVLLRGGAGLEVRSDDGETALHFAMGNKAIATRLIQAGADVNAKDNDGIVAGDMSKDDMQGPDRLMPDALARLLAARG